MRLGVKSDLLECLESSTEFKVDSPDTDVIILDGAVVVNILKPAVARTFDEYAVNVFLPYVHRQVQNASRVDVVWDQYKENSLKSDTRAKHGKGIRRRANGSTNLPGNWHAFLRTNANKMELFTFLAQHILKIETEKQIITTDGEQVLCNVPRNTSSLSPCTHEEADTRMILHVADAVNVGYKKVLLWTVDTDVVVLSVAAESTTAIEEL